MGRFIPRTIWSQYWHQLQKIIVQPKFCSGIPCYTNLALPEDGIYRQMDPNGNSAFDRENDYQSIDVPYLSDKIMWHPASFGAFLLRNPLHWLHLHQRSAANQQLRGWTAWRRKWKSRPPVGFSKMPTRRIPKNVKNETQSFRGPGVLLACSRWYIQEHKSHSITSYNSCI